MPSDPWRTRTNGTIDQRGQHYKETSSRMKGAKRTRIYMPEQYQHLELYHAQEELIEHKYLIVSGSMPADSLVAHAGDIFRAISKGDPPISYVEEKIERLERNIKSSEPNDLIMGDEYNKKKEIYLRNLEKLRNQTIETDMNEKQKIVLVKSLDAIDGLIYWFETAKKPVSEIKNLRDALTGYEKERET